MSDEELTPVSVDHLKAIQRNPHLYDVGDKIDAIINALIEIENQILELLCEFDFLKARDRRE